MSRPAPQRRDPRHRGTAPPHPHTGVRRAASRMALLAALAFGAACAEPGDGGEDRPEPAPGDTASARANPAGPGAEEPGRPDTRTDTLLIEGMPEPLALRLVRAPADFPLPFTTYVPEDMAAEVDASGTAHFTAELGGLRNEDAFVHFFVLPEGTTRQEAEAAGKAYKTSRGIPVSQGLEPIADDMEAPLLPWAIDAFRFSYQREDAWYGGTLGVGERDGRYFLLVRHYPLEYGDGFGPRASLITRTWHWADGSRLGG